MQTIIRTNVLDGITEAEKAAYSAAIAHQARKIVTDHLTIYRYAKETGGLNVNGVAIQTDRESRASLIAARILAKENAGYTVKWKTEGGFVTLNAAQAIAIADAVGAHVQKCYAAEALVQPQLEGIASTAAVETAFNTAYASL
jgi:hypothetical protein